MTETTTKENKNIIPEIKDTVSEVTEKKNEGKKTKAIIESTKNNIDQELKKQLEEDKKPIIEKIVNNDDKVEHLKKELNQDKKEEKKSIEDKQSDNKIKSESKSISKEKTEKKPDKKEENIKATNEKKESPEKEIKEEEKPKKEKRKLHIVKTLKKGIKAIPKQTSNLIRYPFRATWNTTKMVGRSAKFLGLESFKILGGFKKYKEAWVNYKKDMKRYGKTFGWNYRKSKKEKK